jgi:mannitol-specific phosphotransferase system IIBC component
MAYLAVTPKGQHFAVFTGVLIATVASFAVGSFILKLYPVKEFQSEESAEDFDWDWDEEETELESVPVPAE